MERQREVRPFPTIEAAAQRFCEAVPGLTLDAAQILVHRGLRPTEGGFAWRSDPRMRAPSLFRLTEAHVQAFLRQIACPTLMVRASRGWPFDPMWAQRLVSWIPRVWAVEVEGSHHVHLDAAEEVAAVADGVLGVGTGD